MNHTNDSYEIKLAATCLLTKIAFADEYLDSNEEKLIRDILSDFFQLKQKK